jgi:signal transduction histidine kinase
MPVASAASNVLGVKIARRVPLVDTIVAVAFFAVALVEVLGAPLGEDVARGAVALNVLAVALMTLPLAYRRRAPFAVSITILGALAARALVADPLELYPTYLAALVATYSVAAYGPLRDALLAALVAAFSLAIVIDRGTAGDASPDALASLVLFGGVWLIGRVSHVRGQRAEALHRARDQHAAEAVAEERRRIARELHDAVSHSLAAIVMQAGGAQNVLERDPEKARTSLGAIERSAREGLAEMRQLLGLLGETDAERAPQPGLDRLDALIDETRAAGLTVDATVHGDRRPLPPAVDVSAYRILQEALTNVMKHAGRCAATVSVRYEPRALELEVLDDGTQHAPKGPPGRGLVGMRERAAVLGGEVQAGPRISARGFRVHVRLPLEA